nr:hypothetical protein [Phenylobacterium sp.]
MDGAVPAFARAMGEYLAARFEGAAAVLFYGSVLRTGDADGVMDFYVLTQASRPGFAGLMGRLLWPDVSYHELETGGVTVRAKVASMALGQFLRAVEGRGADTTIWTRFVQPAALVWAQTPGVREAVRGAVARAAITGARFAAAIGPLQGRPDAYWRALFRQTYAAEFRVEAAGRESQILGVDPGRYDRLLTAAWAADGLAVETLAEGVVAPGMDAAARAEVLAAWRLRRALGKPLNLARLVKAAFTFDGAARYAAWKIERHTGVAVALTPWRERHPILASPGVLWRLWRRRGRT